jgi:hypothetical protein
MEVCPRHGRRTHVDKVDTTAIDRQIISFVNVFSIALFS